MPEILEIDDDEAQRMQQEADEKKAREEKEHAQGMPLNLLKQESRPNFRLIIQRKTIRVCNII